MSAPSVKSAVRVLEILALFERERSPQTLKSICDALGYPQSSGTVLLKNLATLGYLSYDRAQRRYFPTLKVASLGDWISHALFGQGDVFELMRDLHSATGEAVSIALQNDVHMQYIRVIQSIHPLRFHTEEGSMRPLTQSATGWMLMTSFQDREVERLVRRANIATPRTDERQPLELMLQRVREARAQGYAYAEHIPIAGGATICMLLPATALGRTAAIGIGGPIDRIRPHKAHLLALMRAEISRYPGSVPARAA
ncbi:MAG: helix-turn-helix domain-containing protein [Proteobacteria bacterium]|nr:helix-turn-helix domain-containing protein [Pseudomonadota bacterium]